MERQFTTTDVVLVSVCVFFFFHLTTPFSRPPAMTLTDTPSGWLEKATEQMISLQ